MSFEKGDKVMTKLGPGTVLYRRMAPPDYVNVEAYSVALNANVEATTKPPFPRYNGTIILAADILGRRDE